MIDLIPREVLLQIYTQIDDIDLIHFSHTNSRLYRMISDDYVWHIRSLEKYNFNVTEISSRIATNRNKYLGNFPFKTAKEFYWHVLRPYGHLFGVFQISYPLYQGGLLHVWLDISNAAIVGDKIEEIFDAAVSHRFSARPTVRFTEFPETKIYRKPLFRIDYLHDSESDSPVAQLRVPCLANSRLPSHVIEFHSIDDESVFSRIDNDTGLWTFRTNRGSSRMSHAAEIINAMIQANNLPHFGRSEGSPDSVSYSNITKLPQKPLISPQGFSISCDYDCHDVMIRNLTFNMTTTQPHLETVNFRPRYSKVKLRSQVSHRLDVPIKPLDGVWAGTYGGHGIELVLLRYAEHNSEIVLNAHKISGDMNVPKSIVSWTAFMSRAGSKNFGRPKPSPDIPEMSRFQGSVAENIADDMNGVWWADDTMETSEDESVINARMKELEKITIDDTLEFPSDSLIYPGLGTIALIGFRKPSRISVDVIVLSETELCVYFHKLDTISRFVYIPFDDIDHLLALSHS